MTAAATDHKKGLLGEFAIAVPELPSVIRYYDDFLDIPCSIRNPTQHDIWSLSISGSTELLDFGNFDSGIRPLIKHWCCDQIQSLAVATAKLRYHGLRRVEPGDMELVLSSSPTEARSAWQVLMSSGYGTTEVMSIKSILYYFCKFNLAGWSFQYADFLSTLPLPATDKYASVRSGDVFLSVDEEAVLVAHFDRLCDTITLNPQMVTDQELRETAILVCSFQFGLRPMQIGMLQMRDVRIWRDNENSIASVHLTFRMIKQRSRNKALPLLRKVKREWTPLFIELYERAIRAGLNGDDRIFGVSSARETGNVITKATAALLPESRSATQLRHTAAQRLVDAGASQEELAEFMGHSDIDTGLIYFQTSANQAERVNAALGISAIYQQVTKIAHERFIDEMELSVLKGVQQIGAVPHGIPISGIGGCAIGQPSCPSNPVTACYGCFKFMPINDPEIHRQVLVDFRSVVTFFAEASEGDENSPAYVQLKRTISNVQAIIAELEGDR
jgi:integrase